MLPIFFMKQYVIDELRFDDYKKIKAHLDEAYGPTTVDGIYWIPLESELLTAEQKAHKECEPFYVAVDLENNLIACEFLVRTKNRIRCSCMGYANKRQRDWIIRKIDAIFEKLGITT